MKKIKLKRPITFKTICNNLFKFLKINLFQYLLFVSYASLFIFPVLFIEDRWSDLHLYLMIFVLIFPLIQSFFYMHYLGTGSLYSRFFVWLGTGVFFLVIPIFVVIAF